MRRALVIAVACWCLAPAAHAGCEAPSTVADLTATLDRIESAYQAADTVAYADAMSTLGPQLDCSAEVLPRSLLARIHRTQGLAAFTQQDGQRLAQAFAAAKALEPAYRFPESFVPASHPLARKYESTPVSEATVPLAAPGEGFFLLDGEATDERPAERAVVLQHIVGRNEVALTRYLLSDDRGWALLEPLDATVETPRDRSRPFWIASIATAALGAATYGVAATRRAAYEDAAPVDKPPLRTQTNGLVQASAGLLVVAAGTAGIGLAVR